MTPCPDPDILRRLGDDSLPTPAFREIEAHVADCARCRERLDRLARTDATGEGLAAAAPAPTIPGCVLGRELGRGGWGVVYEAEQPRLGRRVAVKVLTTAPDPDARTRERWLREARAAARVRHPHIVRLHDAGEHDGRLYLVFDLIPGGGLRELIRDPIAPTLAAGIVQTIAEAAEAIHRAGLLHLDIKPANILMDGPPGAGLDALTPMLSDFGIARDATEAAEPNATETLVARGTPSYMAPEQIAGRPGTIGPAADVHALGATLYVLLTGRPPFAGATVVDVLDLLRDSEPTPPRSLNPKIPRDLETICLKALQKSPSRRYASALAMAEDLARWREGRPILARPVSRIERAARWGRRHPVPAALATALGLTIACALIGLSALWLRAEAARTRAIRGEESADRLVDELVAMLRESVRSPERFVSEASDDATRALLAVTADLRRSPQLAARHAATLSALELELALYRHARVDFEGGGRLLNDAVELLAIGYQAHPDSDAGARLVEALLRRAEASSVQSRHDEAATDARRAARTLATLADGPLARNELVDLHVSRRSLIDNLAASGRNEEARRLASEQARDLAELAARFPDAPVAALIARFDRAEHEAGGPPPMADWTREAFEIFPRGAGMPRRLEMTLANLNALEASAAASATGNPKAAAAALLADYDARCADANVSPRFRIEVIECLGHAGCVAALQARRDGDLARAWFHVDRLLALGAMLVDRPELLGGGHVLMSRAHEQAAKIGWVRDDLAAVERSLRASLVEASLAVDEAPGELVPRALIAGLREKYARFAAAEPERQRPVETSSR